MKHRKTKIAVLLNLIFCAIVLWFFTRNAFFRPYLGSDVKEFVSGVLLLFTIYVNYLFLYPKLNKIHSYLYWLSVAFISLATSIIEIVLGYSYIYHNNTQIISEVGNVLFFSKYLLLIFNRNIAFNLVPFILRDRQQLQKSLDSEVKIVYQYANMIDVCDDYNNCRFIPIDKILYCKKIGNETLVQTVEGDKFTRYCSLKYLVQMFDSKEFVRISSSVIIPFRYIAACYDDNVVLEEMSWSETPIIFNLDTKRFPYLAIVINEYLRQQPDKILNSEKKSDEKPKQKSNYIPSDDKLNIVLDYISKNQGCQSKELISQTAFSQATLDRCLSELKKRGLIKYQGSKKSGGYYLTDQNLIVCTNSEK